MRKLHPEVKTMSRKYPSGSTHVETMYVHIANHFHTFRTVQHTFMNLHSCNVHIY